jgi:hypothetical protein
MTDQKRKSVVKHGVHLWLKSGKIRPSIRGHRRLQRYLRDIERDLTGDLGGEENITAAQEILIKSTIQAVGVLLLAGAFTQRYGLLRPDMAQRGIIELQPVLGQQFIAFMNSIRQNLLALGLDKKKGEDILDLGRYIAARDAEKAGQDSEGKEEK